MYSMDTSQSLSLAPSVFTKWVHEQSGLAGTDGRLCMNSATWTFPHKS